MTWIDGRHKYCFEKNKGISIFLEYLSSENEATF